MGTNNEQCVASVNGSLLDQIIAFESGMMESEQEVIEFFQELIDSGLAWKLQGTYGRTAQALIDKGFCCA